MVFLIIENIKFFNQRIHIFFESLFKSIKSTILTLLRFTCFKYKKEYIEKLFTGFIKK
jgi:hypothetical protein